MSLLTTALFVSCEKEDKATIDTNSVTTINSEVSANQVVLTKANADQEALTISWDTPSVGVQTAFDYDIIFQYGEKTKTVTTKTAKKVFSVAELNTICTEVEMPIEQANALAFTINAFVGNNKVKVASATAKTITVTPYQGVVEYPTFYLVGGASYVGWNADSAQILYKKDNLSIIYTYLENGNSFRFLGQQNWNPTNYSLDVEGIKDAYKYFKTYSSNLSKDGDENIKFSGATGVYKIEIDATESVKSLTVTKSDLGYVYDNLYLVGSVTNNWQVNDAIAMTKTAEGVFEHTIALPDGAVFKFLGQKSWGDLDWGNLSGDGNTGFLGPKGDNGNISFDGGGNTYKIVVNLKAGIYSITKQ